MARRHVSGRWWRVAALGVGALMALPAAPEVAAVQFRVHSQTVGDAYQLVTSGNTLINRRRIHQYLGFEAHDLLGDGGYQVNATTLFRFDTDFGLTDRLLDEVPTLRREQLSIQYAWVDARNIGGFLDVRLGRQIHADALDYLMLDGAIVRLRSPWHVGLEIQAGLEVKEGMSALNASMFELDGVRVIEGRTPNDRATWVVGAALTTEDLQYTRARVGYRRLFSDGAVVSEKVGGSFYQRLVERLHLQGLASWDLYNGRFDRISGGLRWQVTDAFDVDLEYVRLLPSFDADSIFNIFTAFPLNDGNLRLRVHPSRDAQLYLGGMVRFFGNEGYTDGVLLDEVDTVVAAWGAMTGYHHRFGRAGRLHVDLSWESGYGGDRLLGDVGGTIAIVEGEWEVDGRLTTVVFDDGLQPNLEGVSFGYQIGGKYLVERRAAIALMVEQNFSRLQPQNLRLFAVIDLDIWL